MNKARSLRLMVLLSAFLGSFVVAAHDFVTAEAKREAIPLKLTSVSSAEKQIVAGTNYRMILRVEGNGSTRQAKALVFRDLQSRYWLKSWEWL